VKSFDPGFRLRIGMKTANYQVFISFKNTDANGRITPDTEAADKVYRALRAAEANVFFSPVTLPEIGRADYGLAIEEALESARILVLVGSSREYIMSEWVRAEWDSFLTAMRSGRKPQCQLFIVNCGKLKPANLPLFLLQHQVFNADDHGLEQLVKSVQRNLPRPATLDDRIRLSLHCRNRERNEDKIYLISAHSPNGVGMNVTAHWGPREAKRLASQLKAINLQTESEVSSLVEKLKKEKLSSGYRLVPHPKLLTPEARTFLEATLGLTAGPKVFATLGGAWVDENRLRPQSRQPGPKRSRKISPKLRVKRQSKPTVEK
jgi:hypothetical protein